MTKKIRSLPLVLIACALLTLLGGARIAAQDPAVVNAKTIRVELENPRVRVLEAVLEPGDKEALHSHPAYVVHVISGGKVRVHAADGGVTESELVNGQTVYRDPVTHWAENIGTTRIHLILVELKDPPKDTP
jgi:quercetin dioxygenase-like cupin family protein